MELMKSSSHKSLLDPRTKILLLAFVSVFVLGNAGGDAAAEFRVALNYLPLLLLLLCGKWKPVLFSVIFYTLAYAFSMLVMPHCKGLLNFLILAMCGIVLRFMPGILTGMFVVSTTTVSEFIAAINSLTVVVETTNIPVRIPGIKRSTIPHIARIKKFNNPLQ